MLRKLILHCPLCPGDVMTMTVAVRSLHDRYPGQFLTDVRTPIPDIWRNNPHVTPIADDDPDAERIDLHYPQINRSNEEPHNFIRCYAEFLGEKLGLPLTPTVNKPCLYLTDEERGWMTMPQQHFTELRRLPYGVLVAGAKCDYTCKRWPVHYFQEVVNRTTGLIQWVQVGDTEHAHAPLDNCINLLGQTDHQKFHRLVSHASIGLGPVTYLMHVCAAFDVPYIYLAGGREPVQWLAYPKQHTLHTIGALPCCRDAACWRSRVVSIGDGDEKDEMLCERPVILGHMAPAVAQCMAMIEPDDVIRIVRRYAAAIHRPRQRE